ncbi:sugar phosphate isomerase/epimerase [Paenibacillus sp. CC-CFT747]|nr:sugar phosphate isomerase/epimerase [Paenibacillus sp. CC-CFT747]
MLGGGKVRSVPDGFPKEEGVEQLARFLASAEEAAAKEELLLALEPLNRKETNVVKRLEDAVELAARLYLPHVRVAADSYHMLIEREEADMLEEAADLGLLAYVHIADRDRHFPGQPVERGVDYWAFFRTLKGAGYEGRICLECGYETVEELERLGTDALRFVKDQWELA